MSDSRGAGRLLLGTLVVLGVFVVAEVACFVFFTVARGRFSFAEPEPYTLKPDRIPGLRRQFDSVLGWSPRFATPHGERARPREHGRPFLMAFGDSHTFCDEVGDDETWETYLSDTLGADVYNFGVGGYGPDQALLRFREKLREIRTPVAALGFSLENINRVVNRYRPFYSPQTGIPLPKPRFVLRGGALELLPSPIEHTGDLVRLTDPAFVHRMGADDYWYSRSGLPRLKFPYTALLLSRAVWTQAVEARAGRNDTDARPLRNLWKDDEARGLFLAILDAFVTEAREAGCRPVLIVQPGKVLLDAVLEGRGIPGHRAVVEHCAERGYACFDAIPAVANDPEGAQVASLSAPAGHLSALGNRILAKHFADFLRAQKLAP